MANMTVSFGGQVNNAGTNDALFLKLFGGEALTAFRESNVAIGRHVVRTIKNGKSAQFPATWKAAASYHVPGTQITGQQIAGNERVIVVDDLLIAPVFIGNLDEAKSHWDYRKEYSEQCGFALSRMFDQNVQRVGVLAARAAATVTGGDGGTVISAPGSRTSADTLIAAAADAAQALDEKNVPENDRFLFVKPDQYYTLINSGSKAIHTDYNPGGNGSVASGKINRLYGLEIVKTNNLPIVDDSANVNIATQYRANFVNVTALAMQRGAVGTVKLLDMAVEMQYLIEYQGWLVVAKYALGTGILRPECAVEIANV